MFPRVHVTISAGFRHGRIVSQYIGHHQLGTSTNQITSRQQHRKLGYSYGYNVLKMKYHCKLTNLFCSIHSPIFQV